MMTMKNLLITRRYQTHLEAPHVPRIAGVLQAVLIALEEEFEEEPESRRENEVDGELRISSFVKRLTRCSMLLKARPGRGREGNLIKGWARNRMGLGVYTCAKVSLNSG